MRTNVTIHVKWLAQCLSHRKDSIYVNFLSSFELTLGSTPLLALPSNFSSLHAEWLGCIYAFTQQTFLEDLPCARHSARGWSETVTKRGWSLYTADMETGNKQGNNVWTRQWHDHNDSKTKGCHGGCLVEGYVWGGDIRELNAQRLLPLSYQSITVREQQGQKPWGLVSLAHLRNGKKARGLWDV